MTETVDKTIDQIQVGDVLVGMRRGDGSPMSFYGSWTVIGEPRVAACIIPIRGEKEYHEDQDYQTYTGAIFRVKKEDKVSTIGFNSKGKHGTITNSEYQKLTGTVHWASDFSERFEFKIDNSTQGTEFLVKEWTFEADKPSLQEQFDALPIGAAFVEDEKWLERMPENFYIKTAEDRLLFVGPKTGSEQTKKFNPNEAGWTEIIRKEIA